MSRPLDAQINLLIAIACLAILGTALVMEYGFGIEPCVLCTYQRIPYVVAAGFTLFGTMMPLPPQRRRVIVMICALAFAIGGGLATYHLGVENAWWPGSQGCTGEDINATMTLADMQTALSQKPVVRCDDVPWTLFGVSLTGWNLVSSIGLMVLCLLLVSERRIWRERKFRPL